MIPVNSMLAGAIIALSLVASLLFLRFWRSSHDRFFLFFALSFAIEAVNRTVMGLTLSFSEDSPLHYLVRLLAYGLIVVAIVDKNRRRTGRGKATQDPA
jgi:hypothetical protein